MDIKRVAAILGMEKVKVETAEKAAEATGKEARTAARRAADAWDAHAKGSMTAEAALSLSRHAAAAAEEARIMHASLEAAHDSHALVCRVVQAAGLEVKMRVHFTQEYLKRRSNDD